MGGSPKYPLGGLTRAVAVVALGCARHIGAARDRRVPRHPFWGVCDTTFSINASFIFPHRDHPKIFRRAYFEKRAFLDFLSELHAVSKLGAFQGKLSHELSMEFVGAIKTPLGEIMILLIPSHLVWGKSYSCFGKLPRKAYPQDKTSNFDYNPWSQSLTRVRFGKYYMGMKLYATQPLNSGPKLSGILL